MRRVALLPLLFAGLAAAPRLTAQASWTPPAPVVKEVAQRVSATWHVAPERVRLQFEVAGGDTAMAHGVLKIAGDGATGSWTLAFAKSAKDLPGLFALARAGVVTLTPVASRALPRDVQLGDSDIVMAPVVIWGPPKNPDAVAPPARGWITRRLIAQGEPLREPAVSPPEMVRSGMPVTVLYTHEGIDLRVAGTAASTAGMGEVVLVRLDASRRLKGIVSGPGLVRIN